MTFDEWCVASGLSYVSQHKHAEAFAIWQAAQAEQAAERERLRAELQHSYVPQDIATACLNALAPLDVVGEPNTLLALVQKAVRRLTETERERDEAKLQCADYEQKIDELCNQAWQAVYGKDRTDWEYPAQAIRHLEQFANEQRMARELAESSRDELRQQIAAKDEALKMAHDLSNVLIGALQEWIALYCHDPTQQTNIQQLQTTIENMGILIAQIDAALNPQPRSIAEGERGALESQ